MSTASLPAQPCEGGALKNCGSPGDRVPGNACAGTWVPSSPHDMLTCAPHSPTSTRHTHRSQIHTAEVPVQVLRVLVQIRPSVPSLLLLQAQRRGLWASVAGAGCRGRHQAKPAQLKPEASSVHPRRSCVVQAQRCLGCPAEDTGHASSGRPALLWQPAQPPFCL